VEQVQPLVEGPIGTFVRLTFERMDNKRPHGTNFGATMQAVSSAAAAGGHTFNMRVLRGGFRVVSNYETWPDPDRYTRTSLFVFRRDTQVRRLAIFVSESDIWDKFILVCIMVSSILLIVVDPLDAPHLRPLSPFRDRVELASSCLTVLFAIEASMQVLE